jgi:hypothetical protein
MEDDNINYLIVRPKYGLCNQLLCISKGIIFAHLTNRVLVFSGFQVDYRDQDNLYNFQDIIDIDHLQSVVNFLKLNVTIYSNDTIICNKIKTLSDKHVSYISDFIPLLLNEDNCKEKYLDIDNPVSSHVPDQYQNIFKSININIKFNQKYIDIANNIKKKLNLKNYTCIHLRLENDSINFLKEQNKHVKYDTINEIYKNKYIDELNRLTLNAYELNNPIYICTSLSIYKHKNNDFYQEIKNKYNLLDKYDIINDYQLGEFREIFGIIDYIIAKDSNQFVGSDWSSFSIYIHENHLFFNKPSKLIDIFSSIKNINNP